jgi:magnesium transporter
MLAIFKNSIQAKELKRLDTIAPQAWISVVDPTEEDLLAVHQTMKVSKEVLEDCTDEFELPRVEIEGGNLIIILRAAIEYKGAYDTIPFTVIINNSNVATIAGRKPAFLDNFESGKAEIITTQRSNFFIKVCLGIIEEYQKNINRINRSVEFKKQKLDKIEKADIIKLIRHEEVLNEFVSSLTPTINTIKKILQNKYIDLYVQDKELVDDLLIDGEQVRETAITNVKSIKNIRDGYTTVMTINLNQVITLLTYVTVIFTIPMVIASIYGMNIRLPFEQSPKAFMGIIVLNAVSILTAAGLFAFYRKKI